MIPSRLRFPTFSVENAVTIVGLLCLHYLVFWYFLFYVREKVQLVYF